MTADEFRSAYYKRDGNGAFCLPTAVLDFAGATALWDTYLPSAGLVINDATLAADEFAVTGETSLPSAGGQSAFDAVAVFGVDGSGVIASIALTLTAKSSDPKAAAPLVIDVDIAQRLDFSALVPLPVNALLQLSATSAMPDVAVSAGPSFTFYSMGSDGNTPTSIVIPVLARFLPNRTVTTPLFLRGVAVLNQAVTLKQLTVLQSLVPNSIFTDGSFVNEGLPITPSTARALQDLSLTIAVFPDGSYPSAIVALSALVTVSSQWEIIENELVMDSVIARIVLVNSASALPQVSLYAPFTFEYGPQEDRASVDAVMEFDWILDPSTLGPVCFSATILDPMRLKPLVEEALGNGSLGPLDNDSLAIEAFRIQGDLGTKAFQFDIKIGGTCDIGDGITFEAIQFQIGRDGTGGKSGYFGATFGFAGLSFVLNAGYDKGWMLHAELSATTKNVNSASLLDQMKTQFALSAVPDALRTSTITDIYIDFTWAPDHRTYAFQFDGSTTLLDVEVTLHAAASITSSSGTTAGSFDGTLTLVPQNDPKPQVFQITYASQDAEGGSASTFTGTWTTAEGVTINDLCTWFSLASDPAFPLTRTIDKLELRHVADTGNVPTGTGFLIRSGDATVILARKTSQTGVPTTPYILALALDVNLLLSNTEFGRQAQSADFGLQSVACVYANTDLQKADLQALLALLPKDAQFAPNRDTFASGFSFAPTLLPNSLTQGITLPAPPPAGKALALDSSSSGPLIVWVDVEKAFGPVHVGRLGIGYGAGGVTLAADAGFALAGFEVDLLGLALSHPISEDGAFTVSIRGLGLSYDEGPVVMRGAFLKTQQGDYEGNAAFKAANFELDVFGAYDGSGSQPSVFVFGMLDEVLGGPAWCFVTGVAAGFGLNRSLTIPSLDALPTFPLVAAALAQTPAANPFSNASSPSLALTILETYIPPAYGQQWLGIGVRFSSFALLESFALISASFGSAVKFALTGLSMLSIPKGAASPIAYAELALEAVLDPQGGALIIEGKLTPQSFILSRSCRLQGGFAFAVWFKDAADAGISAGDFVYTLGGYHPLYTPPSHYPVPPRVGAHWSVTDNLTIDGEFYFALTPGAVMAGGAINAVWEGYGLRAWFSADADFLLAWRPFHYAANIELSLGVSYTIDLLLLSFNVTVSLGVSVDLAGPPLHGEVHVDLYVVSFTISFGDDPDQSEMNPLGWKDFKQSLRAADAQLASPAKALVDSGGTTPPDVLRVRLSDGLLETRTDGATSRWIVNPERFCLAMESLFVSTGLTFQGTARTPGTDGWSTDIAVGPCGYESGDYAATLTVTLCDSQGRPVQLDTLAFTPTIQGVPRATWAAFTTVNNDPNTLPSQLLIPNGLVGASLSAIDPLPDMLTSAISVSLLQWSNEGAPVSLSWDVPVFAQPLDQTNARQRFSATIADQAVVTARNAVVAFARSALIAVSPVDDLTALGSSNYLNDAPHLAVIGSP